MTLELNVEEAQFLYQQLQQHTHEVDVELAHTEKRELQHALAVDLVRLQQIAGKLERLLRQDSAQRQQ